MRLKCAHWESVGYGKWGRVGKNKFIYPNLDGHFSFVSGVSLGLKDLVDGDN